MAGLAWRALTTDVKIEIDGCGWSRSQRVNGADSSLLSVFGHHVYVDIAIRGSPFGELNTHLYYYSRVILGVFFVPRAF